MKEAVDKGELDDFVNKNLSKQASEQLKNVLTNKDAAEKLLSTPEARELMKKLMEGK
jgi:mannitol/fructose-specific phosphotransferase system IIA component (Ntr-type)